MLMIGVVDSAYLRYFDALVSSEPINLILKSFGWLGNQKWGFFGGKRVRNRRLQFCPDEFSLKRDSRRLSERHFPLPRTVSRQFAQASAKRTISEPKPNFRHLRRSSEIPVAQAKYAQNLLLVSVAQANAKRAVSEPEPNLRELTRSSEILLA